MSLQEKLDEALIKLLPLETELGIYQLKRKQVETPGGLIIQKITARAKRISDKDCTGWPTPSTRDQKGGYQDGRIRNGKISVDTLDVAAQIAGWGTPRAKDRKGSLNRAKNHKGRLEDMVMGSQSTGSTAETESTDQSQQELTHSSGQLNPALSRWLMGFSEEWCIAAVKSTRTIAQKPEQLG